MEDSAGKPRGLFDLPIMITPQDASEALIRATPLACTAINEFSHKVLRTRGGRVGSGMGTLLEALWGYYANEVLLNAGGEAAAFEIGWLADHEYNDFACVLRDLPWVQADRTGELFRIEAKSMNAGADESKAHFDELSANLGPWDLLLVLVWSWDPADEVRVYPRIRDHYVGFARSVAILRDTLHLTRGGSFVDRASCPEECVSEVCNHHGEPLNESGKRERLSGPPSRRPSAQVSYAANFGGLVRMLKTASAPAREAFRKIRAQEESAHNYISFIHRNYPDEEKNQYLADEWRRLAAKLGLAVAGLGKDELVALIRITAPQAYMSELRRLAEN